MKKSVFFSIALSLSMVFAPSFVSSTSQAASIIGVAHASAAQITTFSDLNTDKVTLVSLGNSDVPVGQYSEKILTNLGIWNNIQPKISFGTNVKEVLSQVATGSVDCGIVYATDAASSNGVTVVCEADKAILPTPVIYPAAMLKASKNQAASEAFLNFLSTAPAENEFKKVGFKMNSPKTNNGATNFSGKATLNIFAAASLTESLSAIAKLFEAENSGVELVFNFDSSGTLKKQIEAGADVDVFISAAQKQMNGLLDNGYIEPNTKINLLENKVVLIVPKN